jgi:hypothetical protein
VTCEEKFEDIKEVIRSHKSKKDSKYNGEGGGIHKDKQWSAETFKTKD